MLKDVDPALLAVVVRVPSAFMFAHILVIDWMFLSRHGVPVFSCPPSSYDKDGKAALMMTTMMMSMSTMMLMSYSRQCQLSLASLGAQGFSCCLLCVAEGSCGLGFGGLQGGPSFGHSRLSVVFLSGHPASLVGGPGATVH